MFKKISLPSLLAQILGLLFVAGVIYAWQEPPQSPPDGNSAVPLNVSSIQQTKAGSLTLDSPNDLGLRAYGTGGLFAQNSGGYYAYLGYPSSNWSVLANGNMQASDYYSSATGKWMSQLGYTTFSVCTCSTDAGKPSCYAYCAGDEYLLSGGIYYTQARDGELYGFWSYPVVGGLGGYYYCSSDLTGPLICYAYCAK